MISRSEKVNFLCYVVSINCERHTNVLFWSVHIFRGSFTTVSWQIRTCHTRILTHPPTLSAVKILVLYMDNLSTMDMSIFAGIQQWRIQDFPIWLGGAPGYHLAKVLLIGMHSSRMRTIRCSGRIGGWVGCVCREGLYARGCAPSGSRGRHPLP